MTPQPTGTLTHRCIECPQHVEHYDSQMCTSCGRCGDHCRCAKEK